MITLKDVSYGYDSEYIVDHVNVVLPKKAGCILLAGENGAGKSTLLQVLCGLFPTDEGEVLREKGTTIAYLPFHHPLYLHLTVLENLRYFYRSFRGQNFVETDPQVQAVFQVLGIDFLHQRLDQCSSGQAQKAGIACILLSDADMFVLDEPFVALDAQSSERLCAYLQALGNRHTILITSHTAEHLAPLAQRLLFLKDKTIQLDTQDAKQIQAFCKGECYDTL